MFMKMHLAFLALCLVLGASRKNAKDKWVIIETEEKGTKATTEKIMSSYSG